MAFYEKTTLNISKVALDITLKLYNCKTYFSFLKYFCSDIYDLARKTNFLCFVNNRTVDNNFCKSKKFISSMRFELISNSFINRSFAQ